MKKTTARKRTARVGKDILRRRLLEDPIFFMEFALGFKLEWFHKLWIRWTLENPFSVIEGPRGFGKSFVSTIGLIVYLICRNHDIRILVLSETDRAAAEGFVGPAKRILETNAVLRQVFGDFVGARTWRDDAFTIAQREKVELAEGTVEARGVSGQVARTHWDVIIWDDPQTRDRAMSSALSERDWQWYFDILLPTLLPGGMIAGRCTRYRWDDFPGRLEQAAIRANGGRAAGVVFDAEDLRGPGKKLPRPDARYRILKTRAIGRDGASLWEERNPLHDRTDPVTGEVRKGLATLRAENEGAFERQYQQVCEKPVEGELELVFKEKWLKQWDAPPALERLERFMFVDPAWKSAQAAATRKAGGREPDYFSIAVLGYEASTRLIYVLECTRERHSPLEGLERAAELAAKYGPTRIGVERTPLQDRVEGALEFYDAIRRTFAGKVTFVNPKQKKVVRAEPFALACEAGRVRFPPGRRDLVKDLIYFGSDQRYDEEGVPLHDDTVDSMASCYALCPYRTGDLGPFLEPTPQVGDSVAARSGDPRVRGPLPGADAPGLDPEAWASPDDVDDDFGRALPPLR